MHPYYCDNCALAFRVVDRRPGTARKEGCGVQALATSAKGELAGVMLRAGSLSPPAGILPRSWSHYTVPAGMTVIQWVSDFSERIKQLQNISQAAASGGAKELKVGTHGPGQGRGGVQGWTWVEKCPLRWH